MERSVTVVDIDCDIKLFIPNYALPNKLAGFKQVFLNDKLTYYTKLVYGQLCDMIGRNLFTWHSEEAIAEKLNIHRITVIKALKQLHHYRLVLCIRRGLTKTNLYGLVWQDEFGIELQNIEYTKFENLEAKKQFIKHDYLRIKAQNATSRSSRQLHQEVVESYIINNKVINISNQCELNTSYLISDANASDQPPSLNTINNSKPKEETKEQPFDSQHREDMDYIKAETGRVIELVKDKTAPVTYKREVYELFEYWNKMGVRPIHRMESQAGKNCLKELQIKLKHGVSVVQIKEVFEKYKKCRNHPRVKQRMNKGKPINLFSLLDNKKYGGIYDWWEFFTTKNIEEIVDHYVTGKREKSTFNQIEYDNRPDLTKKIALLYAKEVLGDSNAISLKELGTDPRYEKFKETARRASDLLKLNKSTDYFKTEISIVEVLIRALKFDSSKSLITPGHLCSDHTWKTIFPSYLTEQRMTNIKWRK